MPLGNGYESLREVLGQRCCGEFAAVGGCWSQVLVWRIAPNNSILSDKYKQDSSPNENRSDGPALKHNQEIWTKFGSHNMRKTRNGHDSRYTHAV